MTSSLTPPAQRQPSDVQLATDLRSGDDRALAELFQRYGAGLFRLAYRVTRHREDAEDVVQDVFLGLRTAVSRYEEREALGAWLRRLTARRALMQLRSASRAMSRESAVAPREVGPAPDDRLTTGLAIEEALARLPEPLRQVFVLADVEGFTHAEIAELLGITESASRKRRHRAVAQLQHSLRNSR